MSLLTAGAAQSYRRSAAYIAYYARQRPHATAIMRNGERISYAHLDRDLSRMTGHLATLGLQPGEIAAVGHDDLYIQLLIIFGFETLDIVTGSYRPAETEQAEDLIKAAAVVLAQCPIEFPQAARMIELNDHWMATALAAPAANAAAAPPVLPAKPDDPLVIFRSSGTTGSPKLMLLTHHMLHLRLAHHRPRNHWLGLNGRSRYLSVMHFSAGITYAAAASCLRFGACFAFDTNNSAVDALMTVQPTNLVVMPYQLQTMLDHLPPHRGVLLPGLTLLCTGGHVPEDLRGAALAKLCGRISECYGTNEIGPAGDVAADGTITLYAGMEAEVTAGGAVLPSGEIGVLRLRTPAMVTSYLDNANATAAMFRDGWFYPGDLGVLGTRGQLRLIGRVSDVLNFGGAKIAAAALEARFKTFPGLLDIALIQPGGLGGSGCITIFVVISSSFDMATFKAGLRAAFKHHFVVEPIAMIPRTAEGKIKRDALRRRLEAAVPHDQNSTYMQVS